MTVKTLSEAELRQVAEYLASKLRISVEDGNFTDPNQRVIKLSLDGTVISKDSFSVRQQREYEG